jgi:pimeloyl-ACP methyl ester carboxylesterase
MRTVNIKGAQVAYSDTHTGEPVLLIHCSSSSGKEWRSLTETLGRRFRAIVPDQWGCGQSDPWMGCGGFSLSEEAAPILEILDSLEVPVHLVGHSYGGGIALKVARERPAMIRSLTLIEPSAFHLLRTGGAVNETLFQEIAQVAAVVQESVATGNYWGGMKYFVNYWSGSNAWSSMSHEARFKTSQRLPKVVLDFHALFSEPAALHDYASLSHRTLLVCGEKSPGPSRRIVELLASVMPHARTVRISGAGHMSPMTHPEAVNTAIRKHLLEASLRSGSRIPNAGRGLEISAPYRDDEMSEKEFGTLVAQPS